MKPLQGLLLASLLTAESVGNAPANVKPNQKADPDSKPNIVVVLVDDNAFEAISASTPKRVIEANNDANG